MFFKKRKIHTKIEYKFNEKTGKYDLVKDEYYFHKGEVALAGGEPTLEQTDWAFYDDGTESGSVIIGSKNTNPTLDVDTIYLARFGIEETAGNKWNNGKCQLQYNLNGAGFVNVTATSSIVQSVATANIADNDDTTQRMTSFPYIAANVAFDEVDGIAGTSADPTSNGYECLFAIQILSGDVVDEDSIVLKLVNSTAADADFNVYNQTNPTITVNEAVPSSSSSSSSSQSSSSSSTSISTSSSSSSFSSSSSSTSTSSSSSSTSTSFSSSSSSFSSSSSSTSVSSSSSSTSTSSSSSSTSTSFSSSSSSFSSSSSSESQSSSSSSTSTSSSSSSTSFSSSSSSESTVVNWDLANAIAVNTGSIANGSVEDTWTNNGTKLDILETTGTPGFDFELIFGSVGSQVPTGLKLRIDVNGYYSGNLGHAKKIKIWNDDQTQWDDLTVAGDDFPDETADQDYVFYTPGDNDISEYVNANGELKLQVYHSTGGNNTHHFYADYIKLFQDSSSSSSSSESTSLSSSSSSFSSSSSSESQSSSSSSTSTSTSFSSSSSSFSSSSSSESQSSSSSSTSTSTSNSSSSSSTSVSTSSSSSSESTSTSSSSSSTSVSFSSSSYSSSSLTSVSSSSSSESQSSSSSSTSVSTSSSSSSTSLSSSSSSESSISSSSSSSSSASGVLVLPGERHTFTKDMKRRTFTKDMERRTFKK